MYELARNSNYRTCAEEGENMNNSPAVALVKNHACEIVVGREVKENMNITEDHWN